MNCHVCGTPMRSTTTDLPFKRGERRFVIVKGLPVMQCDACGRFLLDDGVMAWVENALEKAAPETELEIVRYAA